MSVSIEGHCDPRFAAAGEAFAANFEQGLETGAAFALRVDGETVVDLWAGLADKASGRPWERDTLVPIFSTTKMMTALVVATLIEDGALSYDQTVASIWPDFAQAGKGEVTVAQALSHQAGLSGFREEMDPADWFDWELVTARLAAAEPLWPLGEGSGYHPVTFGFLAGEIVRRISGRTVGRILREDFAVPFGLDLWIGTPESEHDRVAELEKPKSLPDFGKINQERRAAFLVPWAAPGRRGGKAWREAEFAGANGHATARSLAEMADLIAHGGVLRDVQFLSGATLAALTKERVRGPDRVLPFDMSFGAGLIRNLPGEDGWGLYGPSPAAAGHSGWGGSCAFGDANAGLSMAYVMNRQSAHLVGDPRPGALIRAVYAAL